MLFAIVRFHWHYVQEIQAFIALYYYLSTQFSAESDYISEIIEAE